MCIRDRLNAFGANAGDALAVLGGLAALAGVAGYLAAFCAPGTGSSGKQVTVGDVLGSSNDPSEKPKPEGSQGEGSSEE